MIILKTRDVTMLQIQHWGAFAVHSPGDADVTGSSIRTGKKYDDTVALWDFMETHTWS